MISEELAFISNELFSHASERYYIKGLYSSICADRSSLYIGEKCCNCFKIDINTWRGSYHIVYSYNNYENNIFCKRCGDILYFFCIVDLDNWLGLLNIKTSIGNFNMIRIQLCYILSRMFGTELMQDRYNMWIENGITCSKLLLAELAIDLPFINLIL